MCPTMKHKIQQNGTDFPDFSEIIMHIVAAAGLNMERIEQTSPRKTNQRSIASSSSEASLDASRIFTITAQYAESCSETAYA